MKIILQRGLLAFIDDADAHLVAPHHWYAVAHRHTHYAVANIRRPNGSRTTIKMHRLLLDARAGQQIDHRDGDGLNNRRSNIRIATGSQNQRNQHAARARSGFMGVYETASGKFQASAKRNGKQLACGTFPTPELASAARAAAFGG